MRFWAEPTVLRLGLLSLLLGLTGRPLTVVAQAPARLIGVVIQNSGKPVGNATVVLDDGQARETNERGRFQYDSIGPGKHRISVRAISFSPLIATLILKPGTSEATITLSSDPYRLPELAVKLQRPHLAEVGFYRRQSEERRGRFIEGDSLERLDSLNLLLALSRLHQFKMTDAASSQPDVASMSCRKGFRLWVNGWEVDTLDKAFYLRTINPNEVDGIEIYEEGTPPQAFSGRLPRDCVLAIWER